MRTWHDSRGFSLLELSVVLVIIAVVGGFGITLAANVMEGTDRVTTQQRLITIREALDTYAERNGHLPCPARRDLRPTDAAFGREERSADIGIANVTIGGTPSATYVPVSSTFPVTFTGGSGSGATATAYTSATGDITRIQVTNSGSGYLLTDVVTGDLSAGSRTATATIGYLCTMSASVVLENGAYIGALPTATLGLPANYAADAWGNKFLYAASSAHIAGAQSYAQTNGAITVRYGNRTTSYPIIDGASANGGATYAVVSHGPDGRGAYPLVGTTIANPCIPLVGGVATDSGEVDIENCADNDAVFFDTEYNDGSVPANFFDDYLVFGSNATSRRPNGATTSGMGGPFGTGGGCAPGVCESWCAPCSNPPAYVETSAYVCQNTITSFSPCQATCLYGYFAPAIPVSIPCP